MMTPQECLTNLVASQGMVAEACLARLCASGLLGDPAPEVAQLVQGGALIYDRTDGERALRAPSAVPDEGAFEALHDAALLSCVTSEDRQGVLKERLAALGIPLRTERLEVLRAAGRLDNPRPGRWRAAARPAEVRPERPPTTNERIHALLSQRGPLPLRAIAPELAPELNYNQTRMALRRLGWAGELRQSGELWERVGDGEAVAINTTPLDRRIEEVLTLESGEWTLDEMRLYLGWNIGAARVREGLEACRAAGVVQFLDAETVHTHPDGEAPALEARIARYAGVDTDVLLAAAFVWESDPDAPSATSTSRALRDAGYAVEEPRLRTALGWLMADAEAVARARAEALAILGRAGVAVTRKHDKARRIGNRGASLREFQS